MVVFTALPSVAQTQYGREWSVSLGRGSSSFRYDYPAEDVKSAAGGGAGVGYSMFFSRFIGLSLGLEANMYGSSLKIDDYIESSLVATPPGLPGRFFLRTKYSEIKEKQNAVFLQVPVMLKFQAPLGEKMFFYADAGIKAGFPVTAKWSRAVGILTTEGYSEFTQQYYWNMPEHGFETKNNENISGKLNFKNLTMFAFESGIKWNISGRNAIYTGIYADKGSTDFDYGDKSASVSIVAVGVKIRMAFGSGKVHKKSKKAQLPGPLLGYWERTVNN
jgi:hypothetical protein